MYGRGVRGAGNLSWGEENLRAPHPLYEALDVISYLVHSNGLAVDFDHVHDSDGIVCIVFSHELHKAIVLVQLSDPVPWHVHIH